MSDSDWQVMELMNRETAHHHEEEKMRFLYEASYKGCVSTLNSLLQQDPGLLQKISSQTVFIETPLHISASHGHLEFTKALLSHKPELALERNSLRSTPLHLASAEGQIDIVKQLLEAREEACLVRDQEGRIPLHYAVIRGRRDVALELIRAMPESLKIHGDKGKTVFHLCVTYNQLEMLKDLVALDTHETHDELLVKGDSDGKNTILHLAIMLNQVETVSYLVSIPKIRSEAWNLKNDMGYTAADIVERIPKDSKSLEIQVIIMKSGIQCGRRETGGIGVANEEDRSGTNRCSLRNVFKRIDEWLKYNGDWVEEMRGNLSLVATVLATISFQAVINPPGSVIQQGIRPSTNTSFSRGPLGCWNYKDEINGTNIGSTLGACPGKAILAYREPYDFGNFIVNSTISFVASMIVVLLLVSGVPLRHVALMRLLSVGMFMAVTSLLNAYFSVLVLVAPYTELINQVVIVANLSFHCLQALAGVYIAFTLHMWVVNKLKGRKTRHRTSSDRGTGTDNTAYIA